MKRGTLGSMLILALFALLAFSTRGAAQPVMCASGTYTVDLTGVPPGCFQPTIPVSSSWAGGTWTNSQGYTAPGIYVVTSKKSLTFIYCHVRVSANSYTFSSAHDYDFLIFSTSSLNI